MRRPPVARGFTLVELVVVMVLMGVLASLGMSRFASNQPFEVQGGGDMLLAGLRSAQALASAQRSTVHVVMAANPLTLNVCLDSGCSQPVAPPGGGAWITSAQDLRLDTAAAFSYAPDGRASLAAPLQLQVLSADGSVQGRRIVVEAGSGHAYQP